MRRRRVWVVACVAVAALPLAPVWILWCPGAAHWRGHVYRTVLYDQIARQVTQGAQSTEQIADSVAGYVNTHVWPATDVGPYEGTPLDYLLRGVGWCDYLAKIYVRLLATCGIPARYAMLLETPDVSPHTVAEVQGDEGSWGVHDVLFNIRFTDADGHPVTLEALSRSPALLEAQPVMAVLRRHMPEAAAHIHGLYARVLPVAIPPRRSGSGTTRLTLFDRVVLRGYVRWGGRRFVDWYQDRYLASVGLRRPSTAGEMLEVARHWHLAGRAARAQQAYSQCAQERAGSPEATEARFWLGVLQWELRGDAAGALVTFEAGVAGNPDSRWAPMAWYYMGRCEEALGHADEASAWYAKASAAGLTSAGLRGGRWALALAQSVGASDAGTGPARRLRAN